MSALDDSHGLRHGHAWNVGLPGGRELWLQASDNPILDSAGLTVGVLKIATDITEAEQQAQGLARARAIDRFELGREAGPPTLALVG